VQVVVDSDKIIWISLHVHIVALCFAKTNSLVAVGFGKVQNLLVLVINTVARKQM